MFPCGQNNLIGFVQEGRFLKGIGHRNDKMFRSKTLADNHRCVPQIDILYKVGMLFTHIYIIKCETSHYSEISIPLKNENPLYSASYSETRCSTLDQWNINRLAEVKSLLEEERIFGIDTTVVR